MGKRNWIVTAAIAIVALGAIACVLLIGGGALFFSRHVRSQASTRQAAAGEFEQTRARFAGQVPMIELRQPDDVVLHLTPDAPRQPISGLRVLAYNDRSGRLTRVDIPAWAIRLGQSFSSPDWMVQYAPQGRFRVSNGDGVRVSRQIKLEDIERHGPGLMLDIPNQNGASVLIWAERE